MEGAASALFLLDIKGRILVWRDYRGDVSALLAEWFFTKLIEKDDYVGNKRLELSGQLLSLLFEDLFKSMNDELKFMVEKLLYMNNRSSRFDISQHLVKESITIGLERSLSTGNWDVSRFKMHRKGITQIVTRLSFIRAFGAMTKISPQFEKSRKVSRPRALQPSQVKIHRLLLKSRFRTHKKAEADLFFVPSYVKCVRMMGGLNDKEINQAYVKVLVVANPANTNALILKEFAPSIPEKNITCLTRLDHNRALGQISEKLNVQVSDVKNVIIWGNHSSTQYPDVTHATVGDKPVPELINDDEWYEISPPIRELLFSS